jgi:hypothetical protein
MPALTPRGDREHGGPRVVGVQHRHDAGTEARDDPDRQVDLAEQQHHHDADGDRARRGDLERQVHEVRRGQEAIVRDREDRPDDDQRDDDAERAELALRDPLAQACTSGRFLFPRGHVGTGSCRGGAHVCPSSSVPNSAPVITPTISSRVVSPIS